MLAGIVILALISTSIYSWFAKLADKKGYHLEKSQWSWSGVGFLWLGFFMPMPLLIALTYFREFYSIADFQLIMIVLNIGTAVGLAYYKYNKFKRMPDKPRSI